MLCVSTMAELRTVLQLCLDLLEEDACPRMKKLAVGASSQAATTASEFFTCLGKEQIPFALPSHTSMFGWPSWHNMRMLASVALPDVPYHALPLVEEDLVDLLRQHLDKNPGGCEGVTARDVAEVLLKFYDDGYALHCHRKWLCSALKCRRNTEQSWTACVHMCTSRSIRSLRTSWRISKSKA